MFTIKTPTTHDDFKAYYALRYKVLREPWGHPKGTEKDDYEPISEHFVAVDKMALWWVWSSSIKRRIVLGILSFSCGTRVSA